MPFDISGNFTRDYNFQADRDAGIKVQAARVDGECDNYATGFNLVHLRDGRAPATGSWKMATFKIANLGDASITGDALSFNGSGGKPSSVDLTNATNLPLATGVMGILPEANGGSGSGNGAFHTGMIMYWYGTKAACPAGWAVCDGTNGTPDLRGKFGIGADADTGGTYNKGGTGGLAISNITVAGHTLTVLEIPSHTHADGGHTHGEGYDAFGVTPGGNGIQSLNTSGGGTMTSHTDYAQIQNTGGGTAHSHGASQDTNLPPFMALWFIMRL